MSLKIAPVTAEELQFAAACNKLLLPLGARCNPFVMVDAAAQETPPHEPHHVYGLTISCGSRRHTISSETPLHYETPQEIVARIEAWIREVNYARRWITDLDDADREIFD